MNFIQTALKEQGIIATWRGPEPENSSLITKSYLSGNYQGYPRMVRSEDSLDVNINFKTLRKLYDSLILGNRENKRIKLIKIIAGKLILNRYDENNQRNITARYLELTNIKIDGKLTAKEKKEVKEISAIWSWINSVRECSNTAEADGTLVHLINWPE